MSEACRRAGVKFGVYCSPWDRNSSHYATGRYVDIYHAQIRELLGGDYGEVFEMWFDGANGGDGYYGGARERRKIGAGYYRFGEVFRMVRELQPRLTIFAGEADDSDFRWPGNERGILDPDSRATVDPCGGYVDGRYCNTNYEAVINTGAAGGSVFRVCEADFPLRRGWFYHERERGTTKRAAYLAQRYVCTVGNGGTMNIGVAPSKEGVLDDEDVRELRGFKAIRDALFAHEVKGEGGLFNIVEMREDLANGEQVDGWRILADGREVLSGRSIGSKRIRLLAEPISPKSVRLEISADGGGLLPVGLRRFYADPELVRTVLSAVGDCGETDAVKGLGDRSQEKTAAFGRPADFSYVKDGEARPIAVPEQAFASSRLAAQELADYTEKATGVRPKIVAGESAPGAIVIGSLETLKHVPKAVRARLDGVKSSEASVSVKDDGRFWIVGKANVAELYGTYRLMEEQLGIRWLKPWEKEDPGEVVPKASEVVLDGKLTLRAPCFAKRRLDMTGSNCAFVPRHGAAWVYRVGLQAWPQGGGGMEMVKCLLADRPDPSWTKFYRDVWEFYRPRQQVDTVCLGGGHAMLFEPIPVDRYFKDHPEYFALVDGKRVAAQRYCLSNPEVQHLVARHIVDVLRVTNGRGEYLFGLQDGFSGFCECDRCRALDDDEARRGRPGENITARFNHVVRNIAAEVLEEFPLTDALTDWVYANYGRRAPKGLKHDSRIGAQFCIHGRCYGHRLDDPNCALNVDRLNWLREWMQVLDHGYTYEYCMPTKCGYGCFEQYVANDIKLYKRLGLNGWKEEMTFHDSVPAGMFPPDAELRRRRSEQTLSTWQWLYLASRLTWDPDLDAQAVLDEIEALYYAEAYPAMKKYHALRRRLWDESKVCLGWPRGDSRTATLLDAPGSKEELLKLLGEADALAKDPLTKHRLARDRRWLGIYWIEPNQKQKEKARKAFSAPTANQPVAIDGKGDEAAWGDACRTRDFLETWNGKHPAPVPELATSAAILSDADNLYFLFKFKEPRPEKLVARRGMFESVYEDDSVELMVFPPSEANTYFQVCVNSKGKFVVYEQPIGRVRRDVNVEAAASVGRDSYSIEVRLPVEKIYPLRRGDMWKVHFARSRMIADELTPNTLCWTIDGARHGVPGEWRSLKIGKPSLTKQHE